VHCRPHLRRADALRQLAAGGGKRALLQRGDVSQMSFAFMVEPNGEKWEGRDESGARIRTLTDVQLIEVSVVTIPAYPDTVAALRSMQRLDQAKQARDFWLARNRVAPRWGR